MDRPRLCETRLGREHRGKTLHLRNSRSEALVCIKVKEDVLWFGVHVLNIGIEILFFLILVLFFLFFSVRRAFRFLFLFFLFLLFYGLLCLVIVIIVIVVVILGIFISLEWLCQYWGC